MLCRDRCGYCTFAKPPARLDAPYLDARAGARDRARAARRSGATRRCSRSARRPRRATPPPPSGSPRTATRRPSTISSRRARLVLEETGLLPHANAGALVAGRARAAPRREPVAGDDDRDARRPPRRAGRPAPRRARQDAGAAPRDARSRRPRRGAVHHRASSSGSARRAPSASTRSLAIADAHARHGHVQEVIVQNFLPKPGTAMHRAPACDARRAALDRSRSPASSSPDDMHVQAPPNLSDDLAPLLAAGIDDWGGVSPVTADHVNPERPWPDARTATRRDRGCRQGARPAPHRLSRVRARSRRAGSIPDVRFAVLVASDIDGLARDDAWAAGGDDLTPPTCSRAARRRARAAASARCSTACSRARRSASTRSSRCSRRAVPRSLRVAEVADELRRDDRRRRGDLRPQPQHQLHERLHVQVPVLRVLEGPALAEPPRRAVPARPRGDPATRASRRSSAARPRCACRAASTPTSTATTTSTWRAP